MANESGFMAAKAMEPVASIWAMMPTSSNEPPMMCMVRYRMAAGIDWRPPAVSRTVVEPRAMISQNKNNVTMSPAKATPMALPA